MDAIGWVSHDNFDALRTPHSGYFAGSLESEREIVLAYQQILKILLREQGVFRFNNEEEPGRHLASFLQKQASTDQALDLIELSFLLIQEWDDLPRSAYAGPRVSAAQAVQELNQRFQQASLGYRFEGGQLLRVDSEFIHSTVTRPALALLADKKFAGAEDEFYKAYDHFRKGHLKETLAECLKALESTLKVLLRERGCKYPDHATAKALIEAAFSNGLVVSYMQSHFSALRATLESGVPTIRNREGGHGQGEEVVAVPEYLATYMLNLTATTILFLVKAHGDTSK